MTAAGIDWELIVSFKTELLTEYACQHGQKHFGLLGLDIAMRHRQHSDNDIFWSKEEFSRAKERLLEDHRHAIKKLMDGVKALAEEFIGVAKALPDDLSDLPEKELAKSFSALYLAYEKAVGVIGAATIAEAAMQEALQEAFEKEGPGMGFEEFLRTVSVPTRKSITIMEREDLFRLASHPTEEGIISHAKKYPWAHCTLFLGEVTTPAQVRTELSGIRHPAEELERLHQHAQEQAAAADDLAKSVSEPLAQEIALFREVVYFRNARLEWYNEGCYHTRRLLEEIAARLGLAYDEVIYLLPAEILTCLQEGASVPDTEERKEGYTLTTIDGRTELSEGTVQTSSEGTDLVEVKGTPVFKGKVVGRVCVVKDRSEIAKVRKGDILVTKITSPDFVTAMQKAAAIVTDIGGMASHAAIVARELGKPCVVGTKNATQVFKDDDLIEVDANNGTVRKL